MDGLRCCEPASISHPHFASVFAAATESEKKNNRGWWAMQAPGWAWDWEKREGEEGHVVEGFTAQYRTANINFDLDDAVNA
jgi:hypothetical protein